MKLQLKQYDKTVTIETESDDLTSIELVKELRCLMLAQDYHPDLVSEAMPDEEEISNIIMNELEKLDKQRSSYED